MNSTTSALAARRGEEPVAFLLSAFSEFCEKYDIPVMDRQWLGEIFDAEGWTRRLQHGVGNRSSIFTLAAGCADER
jgi:hypothetical protein